VDVTWVRLLFRVRCEVALELLEVVTSVVVDEVALLEIVVVILEMVLVVVVCRCCCCSCSCLRLLLLPRTYWREKVVSF